MTGASGDGGYQNLDDHQRHRSSSKPTSMSHGHHGHHGHGETTPRSSLEIARQFQETKQRISFAQEQARAGNKAGERSLEDLKKEVELDEHRITLEELVARHATSIEDGLSSADHARRLERNGPNTLTPAKGRSKFAIFMDQLFNFFSILLQIGSLLCFIGYAIDRSDPNNLYLGIVLYVVVMISSSVGYYQEAKSVAVMEGFKMMITTTTKVRRDGMIREIDARDLVIGDLVEVIAGNRIPADLRIIKASSLKVDNSALTGESEPQTRTPECTDENPLETKNLAFFGTLVVEGSGLGMVISCGDDTVMGRIAGLAARTETEESPIHKEIHHFILIITGFAVTTGVGFAAVGFIVGYNFVSALVFMIGCIVAFVPEGLLVTVTVALTLTAKVMAAKNVLVKNLESVETLGSTTTICSDKTGTLTQNRMTVVHVMYDEDIFPCDTAVTKSNYDRESESFKALYRVAALCSRAVFDSDPANMALPLRERKVVGDASEQAILKFAEGEKPVVQYRENFPKLAEIPFNSTNKFQVSVHELPDKSDDRRLLVMKGAAERIIDRCTSVMLNGQPAPLTDPRKAKLEKSILAMGSMGERVLAFAHLYLDGQRFPRGFNYDVDVVNFPLEGLTFCGLVGLLDPPREAVPHAVSKCKEAGIRVIMVTGDHPVTAKAISKQVGIITEETVEDIADREGVRVESVDPKRAKAIVVHGGQMKDLTPEDWNRILDHEQVVFARTSPQQKLLIVEACQRRGEVVAVTGDGVNDSPALKKADIGIAMGITGSDVSKEAADMLLLDDNFASIVNGVEAGRLLFDNLKKSIAYTLESKIPELIPFLAYAVVGLPLPLSTILILCIDLGTDMVPAIAFAYESSESHIMQRPPRNPLTDRLVDRKLISFSFFQIGLLQAIAGFYAYFVVMNDYGIPAHALVGADYKGEWGVQILYCKWDDFGTYSRRLPFEDILTHPDFPIGERPDECKFFDEDLEFTAENYYEGEFDDFLPYLTPKYQHERLLQSQTAFFISTVVQQVAGAIICKTRRLSIFEHGFANNFLNAGFVSETVLSILLTYVPFLNLILQTRALEGIHWLPSIPFAVLAFVYDELRKKQIRDNPGGWVESHTYY